MKTISNTIYQAFAVIILASFLLIPQTRAVVPPPDGGYTGWNTAEGQDALFKLTIGGFNTAVGGHALYENTTGVSNTAVGAFSLAANSSGFENVAIGQGALGSNTGGSDNTATGFKALSSNTDGIQNTATGSLALFSNTGSQNTAFGASALQRNADGSENTATGFQALFANIGGSANTAVGDSALRNNTTAFGNTAIGRSAQYGNMKGNNNTAVGDQALLANTVGNSNTAIGSAALANSLGNNNIGIGERALFNIVRANNNTAIGNFAGNSVETANNVIAIGSPGADVSNTTWIGNVYGVTTQNGTTAPVIVSANGQLGTAASSERFKKDIAGMEKTSEAILSLRPVTFHYKTDTQGTPQFGLIAEEVAKVNPALVLPDKEGKPYTVRYDAVNAMLLNEFLKEHRKNEEQQATIAMLKTTDAKQGATIARQQKQIEALTAGLQKVNAQLELNKPAPQTVLNNN